MDKTGQKFRAFELFFVKAIFHIPFVEAFAAGSCILCCEGYFSHPVKNEPAWCIGGHVHDHVPNAINCQVELSWRLGKRTLVHFYFNFAAACSLN